MIRPFVNSGFGDKEVPAEHEFSRASHSPFSPPSGLKGIRPQGTCTAVGCLVAASAAVARMQGLW